MQVWRSAALASAFRGWQEALAEGRQKRAVLRGAMLRLQSGCLARGLAGWRDAASHACGKRVAITRALRHWAAGQLFAAFRQWQAWAAQSADHRQIATGQHSSGHRRSGARFAASDVKLSCTQHQ